MTDNLSNLWMTGMKKWQKSDQERVKNHHLSNRNSVTNGQQQHHLVVKYVQVLSDCDWMIRKYLPNFIHLIFYLC